MICWKSQARNECVSVSQLAKQSMAESIGRLDMYRWPLATCANRRVLRTYLPARVQHIDIRMITYVQHSAIWVTMTKRFLAREMKSRRDVVLIERRGLYNNERVRMRMQRKLPRRLIEIVRLCIAYASSCKATVERAPACLMSLEISPRKCLSSSLMGGKLLEISIRRPRWISQDVSFWARCERPRDSCTYTIVEPPRRIILSNLTFTDA